jgi:hypothetical protein
LVLLATLAAFLLGAPAAYAVRFTVSKTEAASGEEVPFKITETEAFSTYTLKVESEVVARGSDPAGNGVDDKFKMPDLGSSEKDVTVEATVQQPSSPGQDFVGTTTMRYVLFPTSPTGPTSGPQPEPVPLALAPAAQTTPAPALTTIPSTPSSTKKTKGTSTHHKRSSNDNKNKQTSSGGSGGASTPTSTSTPAVTTPSTPSTRPASTHVKKNPVTSVPQKPSGPVGTAGLQPPAGPPGGGPPTSTPITGTATITKGGFPTAALMALGLLALAALAVGASRLRHVDWHRFRFAFAGPQDPDELRLGALGRAARSGAESQQAIAVRKASRRAS